MRSSSSTFGSAVTRLRQRCGRAAWRAALGPVSGTLTRRYPEIACRAKQIPAVSEHVRSARSSPEHSPLMSLTPDSHGALGARRHSTIATFTSCVISALAPGPACVGYQVVRFSRRATVHSSGCLGGETPRCVSTLVGMVTQLRGPLCSFRPVATFIGFWRCFRPPCTRSTTPPRRRF